MLSYADIQDRAEQLLQDTGNATYDTTELGYWIEDELKRISGRVPHIIEVIFQIESRRGTDATGASDTLTDSVKSQFIAGDDTKEKVVHNTTDDTWAVVTAKDSSSVLSLSRDIMDANEKYEIYNKRCRNKRQIYIGDVPFYLWVDSVEYRGKERNFKVYGDVLELDMEDSAILDSDSTLSKLNPVDVLVRFAVPHVLSQLTDWEGTLSATESEGDTSIAITGMGSTEIIEIGEEFHLEDHRSLYIVTAEVTTSGNTATLTIYPPLEADLASSKAITFIKSTLSPQLEEILCQRVAARAVLSNDITYIDEINEGGPGAWERSQRWAQDMLRETELSLERLVSPKPSVPRV